MAGSNGEKTTAVLMTDLVGSTRLWEADPEAMRKALALLDGIVDAVAVSWGGRVIKERGEGDSHFLELPSAADAVLAGVNLLLEVAETDWPTVDRIQLRAAAASGDTDEVDGDLYGPTVNRCARLRAAAHPGQLLVPSDQVEPDDLDWADVRLLDLGALTLRDIAEPVTVAHAWHPKLVRIHPPPRSLDNIPNNLARRLTSFVGRRAERDQIRDALERGRLVSLIGPGGAGKTTLATEMARELMDRYPDGVWFADLSAATDRRDVITAVASAAGIEESRGRTLETAVVEIGAADRAVLVVLDNCEQVIESAALVAFDMLNASTDLSIIATTREALDLPGEARISVGPLIGPEPGSGLVEATASDAVQLFADRARLSDPGFVPNESNIEDLIEICGRLDSLPLALELASARVGALGTAVLAERLRAQVPTVGTGPRTAPERHKTLQAAVEWSIDLLSEDKKRTLAELVVFDGIFDVEEASQVLERPADEMAGALADLAKISLLDARPGELYRMLGPIRLALLEGAGPPELRLLKAHQRCFARWSLDNRTATGPSQALNDWWDRAIADCRAAFDRAVEAEEVGDASDLLAGLSSYLEVRGMHTERLERAEAALSLLEPDDAARIRILCLAAAAEIQLGRLDEAGQRADEASALVKQHPDDSDGRILSATVLGDVHLFRGRPSEALECWQGVIEDPDLLAGTRCRLLIRMAQAAMAVSDLDQAADLASAASAASSEIGDESPLATAQMIRGTVEAMRGEIESASDLFRGALEAATNMGHIDLMASAGRQYGSTLLDLGRFEESESVLMQAAEMAARTGSTRTHITVEMSLSELYRETGRADEAVTIARSAVDAARPLGDRLLLGMVLLEEARSHRAAGSDGAAVAAATEAADIGGAIGAQQLVQRAAELLATDPELSAR